MTPLERAKRAIPPKILISGTNAFVDVTGWWKSIAKQIREAEYKAVQKERRRCAKILQKECIWTRKDEMERCIRIATSIDSDNGRYYGGMIAAAIRKGSGT